MNQAIRTGGFFHAVQFGGFFYVQPCTGHQTHAAQRGKAVTMTENHDQLEVTPEIDETDYKALYEKTLAESRKWENRSKANAEKAKKFDELESANKTLEERVSEIENANKALEAEKARAQLVKTVAELTGVSENIVRALSATDEESLTAQAQLIADAYKTPGGAPKVPEAGIFPREPKPKKTAEQQFADALTDAGF